MEDASHDEIFDFCGFNASASNAWSTYVITDATRTLTPCAEFACVLLEQCLLLFVSVVHFIGYQNNGPLLPSRVVIAVTRFKVFTMLITSVMCIGLFVLSLTSLQYAQQMVYVIEYAVLTMTWFIHAIVWIGSLSNNLWHRQCWLSLTYSMTSKTFFIIAYQRWCVYGFDDPRTYLCVCIATLHAINYGGNFIEWLTARSLNTFQRLDDTNQLPSQADEGASLMSRLFFCWVNPLIAKGYNGEITSVDSLYVLPPSLQVEHIESVFVANAPSYFTDGLHFSLPRALFNAFGFEYLSLGLLRFLADVFSFAGPILLHYLVSILDNDDQQSWGYVFAFLMLITSFCSALCDFNFNFYVSKVSLRIRSATVTALYDKLLQVPMARLSKFSAGQLINFMSTDVDRIVNFFNSFHALWSLLFKLAIALWLLYREVGIAFISGFTVALLMVPLNLWITFKIGNMSAKMMEFKDQRMRLITETMRAIRVVKLCNWEAYFERRIEQIRAKELHFLSVRKYLDAVCVYLWASAPILILVVILVTYTAIMQEVLTAAKVFTSLSLINILISPLNSLPWVLLALVEAYVSNKRIRKFFSFDNIDMHKLYALVTGPTQVLNIDDVTFRWGHERRDFAVNNVRLSAKVGTIVGVVGPVGAGKSTFLLGILGETEVQTQRHLEHGAMHIPQRCIDAGFAYVGHECWLQRGTVQQNILCGSEYDAEKYDAVVRATALDHDIDWMPDHNDYLIGDDGTTLSGGQRARLALARALYHDADIYLLDDPLASLDSKVAAFVWEHAIEDCLKKRGKLVIIATHHTEHLIKADDLIVLGANGQIQRKGSPKDILQVTPHVAPLLTADGIMTDMPFDAVEPVECVVEEESRVGVVKLGVYWSYLRAIGYVLSMAVVIALASMQISKNVSDAWLSHWTVNTTTPSPNHTIFDEVLLFGPRDVSYIDSDNWHQTRYFLLVYIGLASINTLCTLVRAFLFARGGIVAAKSLHMRLLRTVLKSKISWWDTTPWGRVVNRLCSDVYTIDDSLPFQLNICLASLLNLIGALIITSIALPLLIPFILFLFVLYFFIQRYYRYTTCEVKRLISLTLSPLYSHITDTVTGVVTIRAHRLTEKFTEILRNRLTSNITAQYSSLAASQWLSVRLQLLGVVMVSAVAFMSVFEIRLHYVESGLIGLAITYALSMNNLLSSLLCSFISTEVELVAVERVSDYIEDVVPEDTTDEQAEVDKFLFCRNIKGQIDFASVSLRYGSGQPWALKNVNFKIDAGQRVAIIGRSGAGKSSIFQALLRAHPIETGKIFIDQTIDLATLDVKATRSIFGTVSQSPFIFSGTVRENFCVNCVVSDDEIIEIIHRAGLTDWLHRVGGLDAEVVESGSNFSFGEKQIICLCRLILSRPKIVLIDEATAHLDENTHMMLNKLLRETLPTTTVVAIMHRLSELFHFDIVIQMSNGTVRKIGIPEDFATKPSSFK